MNVTDMCMMSLYFLRLANFVPCRTHTFVVLYQLYYTHNWYVRSMYDVAAELGLLKMEIDIATRP